jgi:hypothetical protein
MIPKIIHYCWFGKGPMSPLHRRCVQSWQAACPDYEFRLWDESNSDIDNDYCRAAAAQRKWAFVSDFVRFDVLHKYGGIYLDTDLELIRPLDALLDGTRCVMARESRDFVATAFIACMPGDPVMAAARSTILNRLVKSKTFVSSPLIVSAALAALPPALCEVLEPASFYPFNPYDTDKPDNARQLMYSDITPDTFGIHHYGLKAGWKNGAFKTRLHKLLKRLKFKPDWDVCSDLASVRDPAPAPGAARPPVLSTGREP